MSKDNLKFTVVVDTNVIFTKDPTFVSGKSFDEDWKACCQLGEMHLVVPEVVKGERLYQIVSSAEKAVQGANKNLDMISKVSGKPKPKLPKLKQLKSGAERLFRKWASENNVQIAPVPYRKVNWSDLVNDAIWRVTPFVPAAENQDSEKGFRDKLILETLRQFVNVTPEPSTVFVSNDEVLREATKDAIGIKLFAIYKDLGAFISYLKLTHENLNKQFVEMILQRSPAVFYSAGNPQCVYIKLNVPQQIIDAWSFILDFYIPQIPQTPLAKQLNYLGPSFDPPPLPSAPVYVPASKEKMYIDATEFSAKTPPDKYQWETTMRFVRLFKNAQQKPLGSLLEWMFEIIRVAKITIIWEATVDKDGNFSNLSIKGIPMPEITSEPVTAGLWKYGAFDRSVEPSATTQGQNPA